MDQFIVYNNIEIFDAAAPPAGEKVSFPPPNDMWRANIISSARRRCPAGSTSNAVWRALSSAEPPEAYILNLHEVFYLICERAVNDGKVERSTRRLCQIMCQTMVFRPNFFKALFLAPKMFKWSGT